MFRLVKIAAQTSSFAAVIVASSTKRSGASEFANEPLAAWDASANAVSLNELPPRPRGSAKN